MPNDFGPKELGFIPRQFNADTVAAALAGLTMPAKTLPARLFYDEEGCRLFYEITKLPEYYLTRTETALLASLGSSVLPDGFRDAALVEFGGSDEAKARFLLDMPGVFSTYVPIDIAYSALADMRMRLERSHPGLRVVPITADFTRPIVLPVSQRDRLGFFPGSTIGNLDPAAAVRFLTMARASLGPGAWFLLGADLRKSPDILLPAYNDAAGVTARFNLNLLLRLNREAGADFDTSGFRHEAIWNDREGRIEMHLLSTRNQIVRVGGRTIRFAAMESIHTENSYKFTRETIAGMAGDAGWRLHRQWTDNAGLFGIFLLGPA